jgi:curved DNA-binding protein CbpA
MANPYDILVVAPTDGDEVIRRRYLELIRRYPPEQHPEQFKRVREAYEQVKDADSRLSFLLFDPSQGESIEELLEEERCRSMRNLPSLEALLDLVNDRR